MLVDYHIGGQDVHAFCKGYRVNYRHRGGFISSLRLGGKEHCAGICPLFVARLRNTVGEPFYINSRDAKNVSACDFYTKNIYIDDVAGEVGDDLVAFNMFDWQDSSINFGPCENVICQNLVLSPSSHYKALRIEPGIYTFDDGSQIDCSLTNAIFRRIRGIKKFKLYCQTPIYSPSVPPERAQVGSGDNIIFEDIDIDLDSPIDLFKEYLEGDPVVGSIGALP